MKKFLPLLFCLFLASCGTQSKTDLALEDTRANDDVSDRPELGTATSSDSLLSVNAGNAAGSRLSRILFQGTSGYVLGGDGTWLNLTTVLAINAAGFNGNLTTTDDTIQELAQKVDDLVGAGMEYPGAGIPVSTGSAWGTSITLGTGVATFLGTPSLTNFLSALTGEGAFAATLMGYADAAAVRTGIGAEPTQTAASQAEAEAGTEAAIRSMSPLRVFQAIAAYFAANVDAVSADVETMMGSANNAAIRSNIGAQPVIPVIVDGSASASLTAAQVSGTHVSNYGMGGADVALTLPAAAAGYRALFDVSTAQAFKWGVRANTTDLIYLIAADGTVAAGSDNGYARMTAAQVGQVFVCWTFQSGASAYDWKCKAGAIGTSTFAAN